MTTIYPLAKQHLLANHSGPPGSLTPRIIVLHITCGSTAAGAIATFESSKAPNRVSAHFVIDRDGTITQLVPLDCAAWHASQVNGEAIGIEHVAVPYTLKATPEQYYASSALIRWLCNEFSIPLDRSHVRTHNEASPRDGHVLCCTGALDPDLVVVRAQQLLSTVAANCPTAIAFDRGSNCPTCGEPPTYQTPDKTYWCSNAHYWRAAA